MLSSPRVNNCLLPYGCIFTKKLWHFWVPFNEPIFEHSKKLGDDAILSLGFNWKYGKWTKAPSIQNRFAFIAPEDNHMLNDVILADKLPDFITTLQFQAKYSTLNLQTSR